MCTQILHIINYYRKNVLNLQYKFNMSCQACYHHLTLPLMQVCVGIVGIVGIVSSEFNILLYAL